MGQFPLALLCDHSQNTKFQKVVKSFFKSGVTSTNLNQYQILHLLSPNTLNYIKVPVIDKAGSQWCQSGIKGPNWALSLVFHNISSRFLLFRIPLMMLLVPWKRPSFDILPHKKCSSEKRKRWPRSRNRIQKMRQMGPPWLGRLSSLAVYHLKLTSRFKSDSRLL